MTDEDRAYEMGLCGFDQEYLVETFGSDAHTERLQSRFISGITRRGQIRNEQALLPHRRLWQAWQKRETERELAAAQTILGRLTRWWHAVSA